MNLLKSARSLDFSGLEAFRCVAARFDGWGWHGPPDEILSRDIRRPIKNSIASARNGSLNRHTLIVVKGTYDISSDCCNSRATLRARGEGSGPRLPICRVWPRRLACVHQRSRLQSSATDSQSAPPTRSGSVPTAPDRQAFASIPGCRGWLPSARHAKEAQTPLAFVAFF